MGGVHSLPLSLSLSLSLSPPCMRKPRSLFESETRTNTRIWVRACVRAVVCLSLSSKKLATDLKVQLSKQQCVWVPAVAVGGAPRQCARSACEG